MREKPESCNFWGFCTSTIWLWWRRSARRNISQLHLFNKISRRWFVCSSISVGSAGPKQVLVCQLLPYIQGGCIQLMESTALMQYLCKTSMQCLSFSILWYIPHNLSFISDNFQVSYSKKNKVTPAVFLLPSLDTHGSRADTESKWTGRGEWSCAESLYTSEAGRRETERAGKHGPAPCFSHTSTLSSPG